MKLVTSPPPTLLRDRLLVSVAAVVWIGGTLVGMGVIGGQGVEEQGDGLFSDAATLIAPHGPAFAIWLVIYAFLAAYIVWQWLPVAAASDWARVTRVPAAASLALNGLWLLAVFAGWIFVSVLVMLGIVVSLGLILRATATVPDEGWVPHVVVGVTFGLYLGWICVATCANIASWLVGLGVPADGGVATGLTIAVLAVVVLIVAYLLSRTPHRSVRLALAAAVIWGVGWVAFGRLNGDLVNAPVAYSAAVAAVGVAAVVGVLLMRRTTTFD